MVERRSAADAGAAALGRARLHAVWRSLDPIYSQLPVACWLRWLHSAGEGEGEGAVPFSRAAPAGDCPDIQKSSRGCTNSDRRAECAVGRGGTAVGELPQPCLRILGARAVQILNASPSERVRADLHGCSRCCGCRDAARLAAARGAPEAALHAGFAQLNG